jgi:hypothetical protein
MQVVGQPVGSACWVHSGIRTLCACLMALMMTPLLCVFPAVQSCLRAAC